MSTFIGKDLFRAEKILIVDSPLSFLVFNKKQITWTSKGQI